MFQFFPVLWSCTKKNTRLSGLRHTSTRRWVKSSYLWISSKPIQVITTNFAIHCIGDNEANAVKLILLVGRGENVRKMNFVFKDFVWDPLFFDNYCVDALGVRSISRQPLCHHIEIVTSVYSILWKKYPVIGATRFFVLNFWKPRKEPACFSSFFWKGEPMIYFDWQ